jgi:hypothetical protein
MRSLLDGAIRELPDAWRFSEFEQAPWNQMEDRSRHVNCLAQHLVSVIRNEARREFKLIAPASPMKSASKHRREIRRA